MAEYIKTTDAIITTWMILRGMGYAAEDNPDMVKTVAAVFDTAPADDVVEVVHASWVWNPDGMDWGIGAWVCGKCKSRPETWWNTVKEFHPRRCSGSHYCGNCGAVMDGGQDDV